MATREKIILSNQQSPGDIVMLTAAVRDLHLAYPDRFCVDVRTPYPDIWRHNPYLIPLEDSDPEVRSIQCRYPLVNSSNHWPVHFVEAFSHFLGDRLSVQIPVSNFCGDVHLSHAEWRSPSPLREFFDADIPFWVIVAGGKPDCEIKWWDPKRFQDVVDHFADRILFVQVGLSEHQHPRLSNVLNLVGKTSLRDLIHLIHHSEGVLCPVTCAMHLAAAVPVRHPIQRLRPCVVVAGGREPPHWEAYPGHQFIHTVGMLPCCATGGCWKSHIAGTKRIEQDERPELYCENLSEPRLPRCMDMINSSDIISRIDGYFQGGSCRSLTGAEIRKIKRTK